MVIYFHENFQKFQKNYLFIFLLYIPNMVILFSQDFSKISKYNVFIFIIIPNCNFIFTRFFNIKKLFAYFSREIIKTI